MVVTAASCCHFLKDSLSDYEIVAGELSPTNTTEFGQRLKIKTFLQHPDYITSHDINDICLVQLPSPQCQA